MELALGQHVPGSKWSGERTEIFKALVAKRIPYPEIARRFEMSVGSICAKANRLGIGPGWMTFNQRKTTAVHLPDDPDPEYLETLAALEQEAREWSDKKVASDELEDHQCPYVLGEPAEQMHCGRQRARGRPYCDKHSQRCQRRSIYQGGGHDDHAQAAASSA